MHRRLGSLSGRSTINNLTTPDPPAGRPAGRAWDEDDDDDEEELYQRASDGYSDDDAMSEEEDEDEDEEEQIEGGDDEDDEEEQIEDSDDEMDEDEGEEAELSTEGLPEDFDELQLLAARLRKELHSAQQSARAKQRRRDHYRPNRRSSNRTPEQEARAKLRHEQRAAKFFLDELERRDLCRAVIVNRLGLAGRSSSRRRPGTRAPPAPERRRSRAARGTGPPRWAG